jgi:hypothetical protein
LLAVPEDAVGSQASSGVQDLNLARGSNKRRFRQAIRMPPSELVAGLPPL